MKLKTLAKLFLLIAIFVHLFITIYFFYTGEESMVIFLFFVSSVLLISVYISEYKN